MSDSTGHSIRSIVAAFSVAALIASATVACQKSSETNGAEGTTTTTSATDKAAADKAAADKAAADKATADTKDAAAMMMGSNWFGGAVYSGEPALAATAALLKAGGGAEKFSFKTALVAMLGEKTVNAEIEKLTKQYGADQVKGFIGGMDFAVKDAAKQVTAKGITLPAPPAALTGTELAKTLVEAGTAPDGTFWSGYLFDKALSHDIHMATMINIDKAVGHEADETTHKILNQAMYDVAQALGLKDVKLATLH